MDRIVSKVSKMAKKSERLARLQRDLAGCNSRVKFKGAIFFIGLIADVWFAFFDASENALLTAYIGLFGVGLWGLLWAEELGDASRVRAELSLAERDE